ncbi:SusC/RagA family TonB-linked outer membrane protein [Capnocytophaga canimorsus]|uniref:SusC/RagA family TonB-linked outer membrane protein n=1 Tax=Capnocytophaga canimorsus TaxID=28188 RepID=UPI0037D5C795
MKKGLVLFFVLLTAVVWGQKDVTGVVKDQQGVPVIGVNVVIKGTSKGVSTDFEGNFVLSAKEGNVLVFSAIGYKTQEKKVLKNGAFISVVMEEDLMEIGEVVVTGYQTVDPTKVATSYTKIDIKNFERRGTPDVISGIEGLSASLVLSNNPNNPTGSKEFSIRGVSTLSGDSRPLIVLDGFQYGGRLEDINPYEVESITLLKDAASASIYGAKSSNGVIVITTRKGKEGKTQVRYTSNLTFQDKMDLGYIMNRVSSSKLVDIQHQYAKENHNFVQNYQKLFEANSPYASYYAANSNRVYYLYGLKKYGYITEQDFDEQIAQLRLYDNTKDIERLYLQSPITNQQNISVSGGSEAFKYRTSLNYTHSLKGVKNNENQRVIFDFISNLKFSPKVNLDFQTSLTSNNNSYKLIEDQQKSLERSDIFKIGSYDRFFDEKGNPLSVFKPGGNVGTNSGGLFGGKDPYEIQRLVANGLLDETYYPALDFGKYTTKENDWTAHVQGLLNIELNEGLVAKIGGQLRKKAFSTNNTSAADSWYMKSLINNTTPLSFSGNARDLIIPYGARFRETRGESIDYLFRTQLEFNRTFGEHNIHLLAGAEAQEDKIQLTRIDRLGYDPKSNLYLPTDYKTLRDDINNVYHPNKRIASGIRFDEGFEEFQNRYIAAYSNFSYLYTDKYVLSGSIRIDQSNLFGTDPKYRYKPFWSLAGRWRLGEEAFLKDKNMKLDLRVSYGVNGNIANKYGPFDIAERRFEYRAGDILALNITNYRINNLRWERSETANFGADLSFFNNRLELVLDYYRKKTTDALAKVDSDPTFGSNFVYRNDASLINNGYEVMLTSRNIRTPDVLWETQLFFRYNKSKITEASFDTSTGRPHNFSGKVHNMKGNEPNSLYVFEYAGVSDTGEGQIRKADGSLVKVEYSYSTPRLFNYDDLKAVGTVIPKYAASMNNNFTYKGVGLSFLFVYQGGHVMLKDSYNGSPIQNGVSLMHKDTERVWQKPGDESFTDIPKLNSALYSSIISGSTKNVLPADFIRLRDVVLSYTLPTSLLGGLKVKELTVNMRAGNLWLWTKNKEGIDPETQGLGIRTPRLPKTYTMGINLIF